MRKHRKFTKTRIAKRKLERWGSLLRGSGMVGGTGLGAGLPEGEIEERKLSELQQYGREIQDEEVPEEYSPEKTLWAATLYDAIRIYQTKPKTRGKSKYKEADDEWREDRNWLFYSDRTDIGSFDWICKLLELDKEKIRRSIKVTKIEPRVMFRFN